MACISPTQSLARKSCIKQVPTTACSRAKCRERRCTGDGSWSVDRSQDCRGPRGDHPAHVTNPTRGVQNPLSTLIGASGTEEDVLKESST